MRTITAGVAALALAATGAYAQGKGNGNGNGNGNKPAAAQNNGNGGGNGNGNGNGRKADRGPDRAAQGNRGNGNGNQDRENRGNKNGNQDLGNRGNGQGNQDRGNNRVAQDRFPANRGNGNGNGNADREIRRTVDRQDTRRDGRDAGYRYDDRRDTRYGDGGRDYDRRWLTLDRDRSFIDGCPPGLAKKRNGCNPPGQVKDRYARSIYGYDYRPRLFGLDGYRSRGDYYYNDGYLVRYGNSGGIASWIPLLGGALGIGNVWPSSYRSYEVPDYYVDYYDLGDRDRYRYADNVIYRVDPQDAAITAIAALITGDDFTVGQQMPRGYDVYNVPAPYRDRYYDTPDRMYRYSDGYVYEVDPTTRLVSAAIDLLI